MTAPSTTIIVLNYNGLEHLPACFTSLRRLDYPAAALELMLVDNGSSDGSIPFVRRNFPEVHVVESPENLGFAAGNNLGARTSEADYVVFLNNDTRVDPGFVQALVDAVSGDDAVVSAGAKILDWSGERIDYAGGWINFAGHAVQRGIGEPAEGRYDEPGPTAYACGGAMIVERTVFLDAGGFDEDYFAIFEDVDLGWRLWLYGHEVVYAPAAVVYHRHHGTLASIDAPRRAARERRNALATIFKNYDDENMPRAIAASVLAATAGIAESASAGGRLSGKAFGFQNEGGRTSTTLTDDESATLSAIGGVVAELPRLREKRADVQARRVRTDRELARFFRLFVPHLPRASVPVRAATTSAFGLDELYRDNPRRVLVFSPDLLPVPGFPTVGSGLRAWGLGQGLRARGHEVVFSMPVAALHRLQDTYEIPPDLEALAWWPFNMHAIVQLVEPDVVLLCGWAVSESLSLADSTAVPIVLDQHGPHMLERDYQGLGDHLANSEQKLRSLAAADYFTCAGELQREYFQSWLKDAGWSDDDRRERSFAMRFSLSPDLPERQPNDELTFVYGGVWLPWQDPTAALLALVRQLDRRGMGKLRLFGGKHPWIDVDGGPFEQLVTELEESPHVVQEGQVTHAELIGQYRRAHVALDVMKRNPEREFAVTSRTVEYLWCGLPVIYNDYSELSALIRDYDAGWTVDPEDEAAIDRALDEAFDDPEAVRRKSDNARRLVREQLNWVESIAPLDRVVREATRRPGAKPIPRRPGWESGVPSLTEKLRWVYANQGAFGVAGKGVRTATRRFHLDHPRNGGEPNLLQKVVWVSLNEGPRALLRKSRNR